MILGKLTNYIDFRFLHAFVENRETLFTKIEEIVEKIKTGVDSTFGLKREKKFYFSKIYHENFFHYIKTKSSLFTFVLIFSTLSQILKTELNIFWTQTCRNWTKLFTWTCYSSQISHMPFCKKDWHNFCFRPFTVYCYNNQMLDS